MGDAPTELLSQRVLPTLDRLNAKISNDLDAHAVATVWFQRFAQHVQTRDIAAVVDLFLEDGFWRDSLALTWELRTFEGASRIMRFLTDRLTHSGLSNLRLKAESVELLQPYPDLAWIQSLFDFETRTGLGTGVLRLVPTASGEWKAHVVYTSLEELKGFPERIGSHRDFVPMHGLWPEKRKREIEFEDTEPAVLVIGGGQAGLGVAARLKMLEVPTLVIDKQARIGDQWRTRYEALCLHDPIWQNHLPYIPFPPSFPAFIPAPKLADWLEAYVGLMELNVWTSSSVEKLEQDPSGEGWTAIIKRGDGSTRTFKPRHIIFSQGLAEVQMPTLPGMDEFEGKIMHSSQYKSAREHIGKKVVVIGAATSGHDIAEDHYRHGVDVTMYQRSSTHIVSVKQLIEKLHKGLYWDGAPPTELVDLVSNSHPRLFSRLLHKRLTASLAEGDKELLAGLHARGFRTNDGPNGEGMLSMFIGRMGGYYLDGGASQLIIDGKIKLKNDSKLVGLSKKGVVFDDGSELPADVVIFGNGYADSRKLVSRLAGEDVASKIGPVWGLNDEGEVNSSWTWSGVPNLHFMLGNLMLCRYYSKRLALLIKAKEESIYEGRYTE